MPKNIVEVIALVAVAADDADIFALLVYHGTPGTIYQISASLQTRRTKPSAAVRKCINVCLFQQNVLLDCCQQMLVLHLMGGCDT